MAMPPKKKFKTKPSKVAQAAAEQEAMKKIMNWSIVLLLLPLVVLGVKQVNPGIFYKAQGIVMQRFNSNTGAARAYENSYKANPERNLDGLVSAMAIHEYEENWEAVEELGQKVLETPGVGVEERSMAQLHLGWRLYHLERYDEAIEMATAAQKAKSKEYQYRAWVLMGAALTKKHAGNDNELKKAYDALDQAIDLKKLFASEGHYYMGLLYEGWKSQTADAIDEYEYGLSQSPSPKMRRKLTEAKSRLVAGP